MVLRMGLSREEFLDRLAIEGRDLMREEPTFQAIQDNWQWWVGEILGSGTYDSGVFSIQLHVPEDYPFKPPEVRWLTPTWHPNLFRERVCIGILGKDWTPANSLVNVIESLRFLLSNPNPGDPLNSTAARQFARAPRGEFAPTEEFIQKAREWVGRFATWEYSAYIRQNIRAEFWKLSGWD